MFKFSDSSWKGQWSRGMIPVSRCRRSRVRFTPDPKYFTSVRPSKKQLGQEGAVKIGSAVIRARVKRDTTAYSNHYTIEPFRTQYCTIYITCNSRATQLFSVFNKREQSTRSIKRRFYRDLSPDRQDQNLKC
jgi:hypothetical protein